MILYKSKKKKSLNEIKEKGRFTNKKIYIEKHFEDISSFFTRCYDWFTKEASKIVSKPDDVEYPIWCATTVESCLMPIETEVVYILNIPDDKVILFDGGKWDYVLNYRYIPRDENDYKKYLNNLKLKGINDEYNIFSSKYSSYYKVEQEEIINSWHRIFNIKDATNFSLQANIWEIRKEWILDIVEHGESIPHKYYLWQESNK